MEAKDYSLPHDNFSIIENELFWSKAFLGLNGTAIKIYLMLRSRAIAGKPKDARPGRSSRAYIKNNGKLTLSYRELQRNLPPRKVGEQVSSSTISEAFKALEQRGLIDVVVAGQGRNRAKSKYAISQRWRLYGKAGFQDVKKRRFVCESGARALKAAAQTTSIDSKC